MIFRRIGLVVTDLKMGQLEASGTSPVWRLLHVTVLVWLKLPLSNVQSCAPEMSNVNLHPGYVSRFLAISTMIIPLVAPLVFWHGMLTTWSIIPITDIHDPIGFPWLLIGSSCGTGEPVGLLLFGLRGQTLRLEQIKIDQVIPSPDLEKTPLWLRVPKRCQSPTSTMVSGRCLICTEKGMMDGSHRSSCEFVWYLLNHYFPIHIVQRNR